MKPIVCALLLLVSSVIRSRLSLQLEIVALRHQLAVYQRTKAPSPTWKAFLNNHARDLVSIDFFVVPTVRNKVLFVLVVLAHQCRR
ncbi:MAG: hypothetical protein WBO06_13415, partial [Gammaproteobacteria bacterium]